MSNMYEILIRRFRWLIGSFIRIFIGICIHLSLYISHIDTNTRIQMYVFSISRTTEAWVVPPHISYLADADLFFAWCVETYAVRAPLLRLCICSKRIVLSLQNMHLGVCPRDIVVLVSGALLKRKPSEQSVHRYMEAWHKCIKRLRERERERARDGSDTDREM